ncbi:MAG TPA: sigma-70 family RNA polymerase sigma factor [Acidimicrobiales bacterium]
MQSDDWLAREFDRERPRLLAVAQRLLGARGDAEDAVQEAWLRLSRSETGAIDNLGGWLTTVVSRVALDMLRSRASRRHADPADVVAGGSAPDDPEADAVVADAVGDALLLVLDTLRPAERLAFVLHDSFGVPFEDVGAILGRSPGAAKQLASRARHKVRGTDPGPDLDPARQRRVVEAFLAAARQGDFVALVALLDPDAVLRADDAAARMGAPGQLRGAPAVAGMFAGRALAAEEAAVDGGVGIVWFVGGAPKVAWTITLDGGSITEIEMVANRATLEDLDIAALGGAP